MSSANERTRVSGRTRPTTMVGGVAQAARRPARLPSASTPDVPFCAVARVATVVVLARRSAVGRRREIADSGCADIHRHSQSQQPSANVTCGGEAHTLTLVLAKVTAPGTARAGAGQ